MIRPETLILVVLVLPAAWSAAIAGIRTFVDRKDIPDDQAQKLWLGLMLAPMALAPLALLAAHFMPATLPWAQLKLPITLSHAPVEAMANMTTRPAAPTVDWQHISAWALLVAVMAVALARLLKLAVDYLYLQRVVTEAKPYGEAGVHVTPIVIPPLAWGRATVILPQDLLTQFTANQVAMIIRHEQAHLRRGDTLLFMALAMVDALLWFNPFVRGQARLCRLAAELACDATVVGMQPDMRETYAETLVQALKHIAGNALQCAPAVFSPEQSGDYRMRITQIMQPRPNARKARSWLYVAITLAVVPIALGQVALSQGTQTPGATVPISALEDQVFHSTWFPEPHPAYSDPAQLHANVAAESVDIKWAADMETYLHQRFNHVTAIANGGMSLRVTCKTTLCEVVGIADHGRMDQPAMDQAMSQWQDHMAADEQYFDSRYGSGTFSIDKDHAVTGMAAYFVRKGAV